MKVSKVFGCVLGLHFGVVAVLLIQPGCRTQQPPTQTFGSQPSSGSQQSITAQRTVPAGDNMTNSVRGASRQSDKLIPATRFGEGDGLDAAFNAGFDGSNAAPGGEFSEFDSIAPIEPLPSGGQTVNVAGASFETYTVKKGDSLWGIARRNNVSVNELYAANGMTKDSVLQIGREIRIPTEGGTAIINTVTADSYQPTSLNQSSVEYTVKRGDALSRIARQYDTSVRAIKAANGKTSDLIRVGETLVIPVGANASVNTSTSTVAVSSSTPGTVVTTSGTRTHTVKAGEFPGAIARKYGMTTGELLATNGITDPRKLRVGTVLKVSDSGSAANVDSRTETVVAPAPAQASTTPAPAPAPAPSTAPVADEGPVEIRVIEADPLVEGEANEIQTDDLFEGAVEIPVIRLED